MSRDEALPSAEDIAEYLSEHPQFFRDREQLLQNMNLGQDDGKTVSLAERQLSILREENSVTRGKLDELMEAARQNNEIFDKCSRLVLELIGSENDETFFSVLESSLRDDFQCSAYSLIVFDDEARQINHFTSVVPEATAREYIGALMRAKEPALGVLRPEEQDFLFRHASDRVASAAVLALRGDGPSALLAIGSSDPHYFKPALGTLFIGFLADVLARLLPARLGT